MVEVLAVLRTVEEKYGRITEFHVTKDFEMPDRPFAMIFASFADPASFKLVPPRGIEIVVPAPEYEHKPGGPGWKDIEEYLDGAERDPEFDHKQDADLFGQQGRERNHVYVRVSPSKKELVTFPAPPTEPPIPEMQRRAAEHFLHWGSAHILTPISSERPIHDKELFGESSLDSVRMRAALRWAAKALNERSPHEIYPEGESNTTSSPEPGGDLVGQEEPELDRPGQDMASTASGEDEEPLNTSKQ